MSAGRATGRALPPVFLVAWAILFTFPLLLHMSSGVALARGGDAWLHMWDLWWVDKSLMSLHANPYFTNFLLYPTGLNLYYHSLNILNGIVSIPLQHLLGLTTTFNVLMIANLTLDGLAAYWLCLERTRSMGAALVGGAIFASTPLLGTSVDLGQLDEVSVFWVPLYMLALWRAIDSPGQFWRPGGGRRAIVAAAACLVGSALATWYFTAGLVVLTVVFVPVYLATRPRSERDANTTRFWLNSMSKPAVVGLLFALVLSPLLWAMIRERLSGATYMLPTLYTTLYNSADVVGLVLPARMQTDINQHGSTVALGYVALALALAGLAAAWRKTWPVGLACLVLIVMSLGPQLQVGGNQTGIPLPYALLNNVPFVGASRQPLRFLATAGACIALLAAFGVHWLTSNAPLRQASLVRYAAVPVLLALLVAELFGVPRAVTVTTTDAAFDYLKQAGTGAVLEVPNDEWSAPSLLNQTTHERPIMGGYTSRHFPYAFGDAAPGASELIRGDPDPIVAADIVTPSVADTARTSLDHYNIRYVVVHKVSLATGHYSRLQSVLDALYTPEDVVFEDDDIVVYKTAENPDDAAARLKLQLVGLGNGWHKVEQEPLHRWTGANVTDANAYVWVGIPEGVEGQYRLSFTVYAYKSPRHVSVILDGRELMRKEVGTAFEDIAVDLGRLDVGDHDLLLKVDEQPESPPGDTRKLGVGVTSLAIVRTVP